MRHWSAWLSAGTLLISLTAGCDLEILRKGLPMATPTPTPMPLPSPVTARDLTGRWVYGSTNEPSPGPVISCYPFSLWNLTQTRENLAGGMTTCVGPCGYAYEDFVGTNHEGSVSITATVHVQPDLPPSTASYVLSFDAATQHLVGTRNGEPFWAAPFVQKSDCGPAPL